MTVLGLSSYQWAFDSYTIGASTNVDVMKVTGLLDLNTADADRQQSRQDGNIIGIQLIQAKIIELALWVRKGSLTNPQYRALIQTVENTFSPNRSSEAELHWKMPEDVEMFCYARTSRRQREIAAETERGITPIIVQLKTSAGVYWDASQDTLLNRTGTFNVTNEGNVNAYPILTFNRLDAGITSLTLTNNTTGVVLAIAGLAEGSTDIIVDMDAYYRSLPSFVIYEGSTNHYGKWTAPRTPFYLAPGVNSLTLTAGPTLDLAWYNPRA